MTPEEQVVWGQVYAATIGHSGAGSAVESADRAIRELRERNPVNASVANALKVEVRQMLISLAATPEIWARSRDTFYMEVTVLLVLLGATREKEQVPLKTGMYGDQLFNPTEPVTKDFAMKLVQEAFVVLEQL